MEGTSSQKQQVAPRGSLPDDTTSITEETDSQTTNWSSPYIVVPRLLMSHTTQHKPNFQ